MFGEETRNEEDDNNLDNSDSTFKKVFFKIITPLVSEEYFNYLFKILILIIETLQILSFAFKDSLIIFWKSGSIINTIASFFKYFMIMPYLEMASFFFYITIVYIICGFIFAIFLLMIYMNIGALDTMKQTRQNHMVLQCAKIICELLPYVLYMPMLEVLIQIFNCSFDNVQAKWINNLYSDTVCYENIYILHIFISALTIIFLLIFTFFVNLFYYESRLKSQNFLAKRNGKVDIFFFLYKTLLIVIFITISNYSDTLMVFFLTIPPFLIFIKFMDSMPFYNLFALKLNLLQHSLITWTGLMLIFGKITFDVTFDANLFIFLFGIVFLGLIIFMRKEFRYDLLLININKIDSVDIFLQHIHYLIILCEHYKNDHGVAVLIDGYVQYHKTICQEDDCPSKKDYLTSKKHQKFLDLGQDEQIIRITYMINSFFMNILQKKPYNPTLRIQYALFLLDKINQKQLALQEIINASNYKPAWDEEFLIFRFKKIIEEELLEKKKEDKLLGLSFDSINELALNSLVKQIKINIEKSANHHLEFWSQLSEDTPDLGKLFEIGNRITIINSSLEDDWERLQRMNIVLPSLYRLYAGFLITILGDKFGSFKIFSKLDNDYHKNSNNGLKNTLVSEFVNNSMPVIFMSGEEGNLGVIINLNQSAAGILGYNKSELLNKKINIIQPASIGDHHDQYIENYLLKLEAHILNKETLQPFKHKSGYLTPMFLNPRCVPFALQGTQFFATFRPEKTFKTYLYIYCDANGIIELFSSSCLNVLNLDKKKLVKNKKNITEIIPSFFDNLKNFKTKSGGIADVQIQAKIAYTMTNYTTTMPATLKNKTLTPGMNTNAMESENNLVSSNDLSHSNINIDENPVNMGKEGIVLYKMHITVTPYINKIFGLNTLLVRIEYKEKPLQKTLDPFKLKVPLKQSGFLEPQTKKPPMFSLMYDVSHDCYKGELLEGQDDDIDEYINQLKSSYSNRYESSFRDFAYDGLKDSCMHESEIRESVKNPVIESKIFKKLEENLILKQKEEIHNVYHEVKDWGKGIKSYRLMGDRLYDLEELKKEEEENESEPNEKLDQENSDVNNKIDNQNDTNMNVNLKNSKNIFRNRSNFQSFLKRLKTEKSGFVKNLHIISILILVLLGLISSLNHFLISNEFELNQNSYNLIDWSNQRIAETQLILYKIMELGFIREGVYSKTLSNDYEQTLRTDLKNSILSLESLQNQLVLNTFGLNDQHKVLYNQNSIRTAYLSSNGSINYQNFDINQITSQIISKAFVVVSKPLDSFITSDSDFFYLEYNLINDYYVAMREETGYFIDELNERMNNNITLILTMIIVSAIILFVSFVILTPIYSLALMTHHKILLIFLDISLNNVKKLFAKCEGFLNHLQIGEEEDDAETNKSTDENFDEEQDVNEGLLGFGVGQRKKRKKYKLNNSNKLLFVGKIIFISLVIESFFIGNYNITSYFSNEMTNLINEINVTSMAESYYSFSNNLLRQNLLDSSFNVTSNKNSGQLLDIYTDILISIISNIQKMHSLDQSYQDSNYNGLFEGIFNLDLCIILNTLNFLNSSNECDSFADGSLTQGLSLTLYRFIDNFREVDGYMKMIRVGNITNITQLYNESDIFRNIQGLDKLHNNLLNLLNLPKQQENNELQNNYLKFSLRYLMQNQLNSIKTSYSNTMNSRMILYVCFIILLFLIYLFFWLPIINQLNNNLFKIKRMLSVIPLEIIDSNRIIRENIQMYLNIHD